MLEIITILAVSGIIGGILYAIVRHRHPLPTVDITMYVFSGKYAEHLFRLYDSAITHDNCFSRYQLWDQIMTYMTAANARCVGSMCIRIAKDHTHFVVWDVNDAIISNVPERRRRYKQIALDPDNPLPNSGNTSEGEEVSDDTNYSDRPA